MALLHWKPEYTVGIDAVDHEHKELIDLINRLHAALPTNSIKDSVEPFLGDLFKAISGHFALEERFMRERDYDQLQIHKNDHERLLDEIREIMESFVGGDAVTDDELSTRLQRWFSQHFETHDARLHRMLGHHSH